MNIREWNEIITKSRRLAHDLELYIRSRVEALPYVMYDGDKGIKFIIYDFAGNVVNEFYSGSYNSKEKLLSAINYIYRRIMKEV